jgi:hypothetical protein
MIADKTVMAATMAPETMATLPRGPFEMLSDSREVVDWGGDVEEDGSESASADMKEEDEEEEDEEKEVEVEDEG